MSSPRSLTEMLSISSLDVETVEFEGYLSDNERFCSMLKDDVNYNLIAQMNAGKTYSIVKAAHELGIKVVIALPLVMTAVQLAQKVQEFFCIPGLINGGGEDYQGTDPEEISSREFNSNIIIVVYNSVSKLRYLIDYNNFDNMGKRLSTKDHILVIDESHNLVTQYDFRSDCINKLVESKSKFRKVIHLTGTPEATSYFYQDYSTVVFNKKTESPPDKIKLKLIPYSGDTLFKVVNHLLSNRVPGLMDVILLNNKKELFLLNTILKDRGLITKVLTAEDKVSEECLHMIALEKIPSNLDVLLTTRVISDGANLYNENIDTVYIIHSTDHWMNRQFISRFRRGIKNEVLYFLQWGAKQPYKLFNLKQNFETRLESEEKMFMAEISYKDAMNASGEYKKVLDERNIVRYMTEAGPKISHPGVAYSILKTLNEKISSFLQLTEEYYQKIASYDCTRIEFNQLNYKEILSREEYNKYNQDEIEDIQSDFDSVQSNINRIFTGYLSQQDHRSLINRYIDPELIYNGMHLKNSKFLKQFMKKPSVEKTLNLGLQGYPRGFLILLLKLYNEKKDTLADNIIEKIESHLRFKVLTTLPDMKNIIYIYPELSEYRLTQYILENVNLGKSSLVEARESTENLARSLNLEVDRYFFKNQISGIFKLKTPRSNFAMDFTSIHEILTLGNLQAIDYKIFELLPFIRLKDVLHDIMRIYKVTEQLYEEPSNFISITTKMINMVSNPLLDKEVA